jgi:hypothetical protein
MIISGVIFDKSSKVTQKLLFNNHPRLLPESIIRGSCCCQRQASAALASVNHPRLLLRERQRLGECLRLGERRPLRDRLHLKERCRLGTLGKYNALGSASAWGSVSASGGVGALERVSTFKKIK